MQNLPYLTKYEDFIRLDALLMTKYHLVIKSASLHAGRLSGKLNFGAFDFKLIIGSLIKQ